MDRAIRHFDVQRVLVGIGINRDGLDAEPAGGLDDAAGDLAAIGNQDALEHRAPHLAFASPPEGAAGKICKGKSFTKKAERAVGRAT